MDANAISIHAPREGGDNGQIHIRLRNHISIHAPPRGGRLLHYTGNVSDTAISIHAPREGGDLDAVIAVQDQIDISIHAPREGGDPQQRSRLTPQPDHFNPRPPRGGRLIVVDADVTNCDFNPRPPRGGRHHHRWANYPTE